MFKDAALYDFVLDKQLEVTGFPAVLVQTGETSFYLLAKGYTNLETLETRFQNIMTEIKSES